MEQSELLSRWSDLESGRGLHTAKAVSRRLSLLSLVICTLTAIAGIYFSPLSLAFAIPGIVIGYLIAERNALESRAAQWNTLREYIDWPKVRRELGAHSTKSSS